MIPGGSFTFLGGTSKVVLKRPALHISVVPMDFLDAPFARKTPQIDQIFQFSKSRRFFSTFFLDVFSRRFFSTFFHVSRRFVSTFPGVFSTFLADCIVFDFFCSIYVFFFFLGFFASFLFLCPDSTCFCSFAVFSTYFHEKIVCCLFLFVGVVYILCFFTLIHSIAAITPEQLNSGRAKRDTAKGRNRT